MNDNETTDTNIAAEASTADNAETSISAALDTFNANTSDDAPVEDLSADTAEPGVGGDESPAEEGAANLAAEGGEQQADSGEQQADSGEQQADSGEQQADSGTPTLPAAHIRSLKAYGWSDEEVAEARGQTGFAATAAKIHAQRTREIQQWANHGRQKAEQEETAAPAAEPKTPYRLDVAALREKYGDSDLLDELVGPLNARLELLDRMLPDLESGQVAAQQAKMEAARSQVDGFFTNEQMKPYAPAYGSTSDSLTDEQTGNRIKLLQTADYIRTGAASQGQNLSINEAMAMAHEVVGGAFKTAAVRNEIRGQIKRRTKGASLRPGTQVASQKTGTATTQEQLINNTRARLAKLGD